MLFWMAPRLMASPRHGGAMNVFIFLVPDSPRGHHHYQRAHAHPERKQFFYMELQEHFPGFFSTRIFRTFALIFFERKILKRFRKFFFDFLKSS
jgi:hypothetical protein